MPLLLWLATVAIAFGVPATLSLKDSGHAVRHWGVDQGLPAVRIFSLAQTPDGYIWIGTELGVVRYDGVSFKTFTLSEIPGGSRIQSLFCDSRGRLWIGRAGTSLVLYERGVFRVVEAKEGAEITNTIDAIAEDPEGEIWFLSVSGGRLTRFREDKVETTSVVIPRVHIRRMGFGRDGQLFYATEDGAYSWSPGEDGQGVVKRVGRSLFVGEDGVARIVSDEGAFRFEESRLVVEQTFKLPPGEDELPLFNLAGRDSQGAYWLVGAGEEGIQVFLSDRKGRMSGLEMTDYEREWATLDLSDRLSYFATSLLFARDGTIWLGTYQGVFQFRKTLFRTPPPLRDLAGRSIRRIRESPSGKHWFTSHQGLACFDATTQRLSEIGVQGVASVIDKDTVWTQVGERLRGWRYDSESRQWKVWKEEFFPNQILDLHLANDGHLYAATGDGVYRMKKDGVEFLGPERGVRADVMTSDREGRLYVFGRERGIYRYDGEGWTLLSSRSEGGRSSVSSMTVDDSGVLWVAGRQPALERWRDGRWFRYDAPGFDWPLIAIDVLSDSRDGLWLATSGRGVLRLDRRTLEEVAEGRSEQIEGKYFDTIDGLPTRICSGWNGGLAETSDGTVWVSTSFGPAAIDLDQMEAMREATAHQEVVIQEVLVDDDTTRFVQKVAGGEGAVVEMGPERRRVEFVYTAPNFETPEKIRFRYRLEGIDDRWIDAGAARATHYQDLPPGDYLFRVSATNSYGVWNDEGTSIQVRVLPAWYQRKTVRMAAVLAAFLAVGWFFWLVARRVRRRSEAQERFSHALIDSQERERKRIAGELHDSLGHDLILIKQSLDLSVMDLENGTKPDLPLERQLSDVAEVAAHAIEEVRAITEDLRPPELSGVGLATAVETMTDRVEEHTGIRVHCHVTELDQDWKSNDEINIYRIVQECLNNAVKHAGAKAIWISCDARDGALRIVVEDDGKGYEPATRVDQNGERGHGLEGIEKRARMLGSRLAMTSGAGKGTRCTIEVPLPNDDGDE